jgi:hypothetical protein
MDIKDIKRVEVPFTLYDFFGYLLPGLTFGALTFLSFDLPKAVEHARHTILGIGPKPTFSFLLSDIVGIIDLSPFFISVLIIVIAYILGHIIASLSSLLFERVVVLNWLSYPAENMFPLKERKKPFFFRNYRRAYSEQFVSNFRTHFESRFGIPLKNPSDVFWLTFEFVAHNCPSAFARSMHFLNLYGFSRNLSMSFLSAAVFLLSYELAYSLDINWLFLTVYTTISFSLFWNHLKLLRRLNDEVFRGFYSFASTDVHRSVPRERRKRK